MGHRMTSSTPLSGAARVCAVIIASVGLPACAPLPPCFEDYQGCDDGQRCAEGASCEHLSWTYGEGDICMRGCHDQRDCPRQDSREARCVDVNNSGSSACYRTCGSDSGCPSGWVCQPVRSVAGLTAICLP